MSLLNREGLILVAVALCGLHQASAQAVLEETIEHTYAVEPTAKLNIRNTDGSIRVYGADIKEMKLQAIKRAYNAERLSQISVDVSTKPGEISIETQYPSKPKWGVSDRSGTVDYVIIMPWTCDISQLELANGEVLVEGMRGRVVRANLGNGRLFGHNCFTDLHVAVANGGLDVGYDWWEPQKISIDADIVNGNARAFFPGDAAFHLQAESLHGHVASDFMEKEQRQKTGARKIDMLVGGASESEVKFHAVNGSIKIGETNQ